MDKPFEPILDIRGLKAVFRLRGGDITAINDIDLTIAAGETVALVGESGSAKCRGDRRRQHSLQVQRWLGS
jgi:peptide/nickel transport system ATP-binding protein